jgi:hypothetical protein
MIRLSSSSALTEGTGGRNPESRTRTQLRCGGLWSGIDSRAGTSGFAADVQDVGTLVEQAIRVLNRPVAIEKLAAVRKRIGRDIDNPHHEGALA